MVDVVAAYVSALRAFAAAKSKLTFAAKEEAWRLIGRKLEEHGYRGKQGGDILATIYHFATDEMRASFPKHADRL